MPPQPEFADAVSSPLGAFSLILLPIGFMGLLGLSSWLLQRLRRRGEDIWPTDHW